MGISNFCKLIDSIIHPKPDPLPFDSILIDVQSYLYTAIHYSFRTDEEEFIQEICESTWNQINKILVNLFESDAIDHNFLTIVLSFDGVGVAMKWPTQRQRRSDIKSFSNKPNNKKMYQISLFGVNKISTRVQEYVLKRVKKQRTTIVREIRYIICGCNVPGEGEHKIFHVAEATGQCRRPVVVSVDQDVFVIALMNHDRYDTIQIHRYRKFYDLSLESLWEMDIPWNQFLVVSFLFGNDFAPCLVGITDTNGPSILTVLHTMQVENEDDPTEILAKFLTDFSSHLRFHRVAFVDITLLVQFWMCYLWVNDYYTRRDEFKQKNMENLYFDRFNRDQVLTGLSHASRSLEAYEEAKQIYSQTVTKACADHVSAVFLDPGIREQLSRFWEVTTPTRTFCSEVRVIKR
jgi:hypothetical protein